MRYLLACAAAFATSSALAASPPTDLRAAGPWQVDFADAACLLSRPFAASDGSVYQVELTFEPTQVDAWLRVRSPEKTSRRSDGETIVEMDGTRIADDVHYNIYSNPAGGTTREYWLLDARTIGATKQSLRLLTRKHGDLRLAMDGYQAAARVVDRCMDDLHRSLGIDPAILKSIVVEPEGDSPLRLTELPTRGSGFRIVLLYWVTETGKIENCRVLKPSGFRRFDENVCARFQARGRFKPARNAAGDPIRAPVYDDINIRISSYPL